MSTAIKVWVVDVETSAILCFDNLPSALTLSSDFLPSVHTYQYTYLYKDKVAEPNDDLPAVVITLSALEQLNLIKYHNGQYFYNKKPYELLTYRQLVTLLPLQTAHHVSHAIQLMRWRADHRFCSRCGTPTFIHPNEYASTCQSCHHRSYPRISPCVITAVTRLVPATQKPQILLALHRRHRDGIHGLIAGFVEIGESLEQAVNREILEETGVHINNIRYVGSQPWPYPSNLMVGFIADFASGEIVAEENELIYAKFFDLDNLPKIPNHGSIARKLIEKIKSDFNII